MARLTIITGASRGLGLELARASLKSGDTVVTLERKPTNTLVAEAKQKNCQFIQFSADLVNLSSGISLLNWWLTPEEIANFDSVALINNAGTLGPVGFIEEAAVQEIADCIKVNYESPVLLISTFLKLTQASAAEKRIMNISSGAARRNVPGWAVYCSSKAGLDRFTAVVAADEARKPNGAKLCSIAPGVLDTDMQAQIRGSDPRDFPETKKFVSLFEENKLVSPASAAKKLINFLYSNDFGVEPITDLRTILQE